MYVYKQVRYQNFYLCLLVSYFSKGKFLTLYMSYMSIYIRSANNF